MRVFFQLRVRAALVMALLASAASVDTPANAATKFDVSFTGFYGSTTDAVFTTKSLGGGEYLITGVSGTLVVGSNSYPMSFAPVGAFPASNPENDNIIYFPEISMTTPVQTTLSYVDVEGIAFDANSTTYAIWLRLGFGCATAQCVGVLIPGVTMGNSENLDSFTVAPANNGHKKSGSALGLPDVSGDPTPLPAALPLFATGLGALGLLGWRRKRKQNRSLSD